MVGPAWASRIHRWMAVEGILEPETAEQQQRGQLAARQPHGTPDCVRISCARKYSRTKGWIYISPEVPIYRCYVRARKSARAGANAQ